MKNYTYQNNLISKKQLRQLLGWSFTNYNSTQACSLADELKYLGFRYASQAGISISIEDLKVPFIKKWMIKKANQEIQNIERVYLKGKTTDVERLQKIIETWNLTSESLKNQIVYYFKNYDPLNSVYIMAFSGARGNLSQVRQLVGMRGLMSDPSGQSMNLAITKNFREGLTITDYLMSGYGARKGIVDTALKTANSGYLTRRLIDVAQDILIREKDCGTTYSLLFLVSQTEFVYEQALGRILNKPVIDPRTNKIIANRNTQITSLLIQNFKEKNISRFYVRSPLTCKLYRSICQKCYGWDLATENLVDIGETIGILAGQSIGEPGTQLTMRTFHTGGVFTSEARERVVNPLSGIIKFYKNLKTAPLRTNRGENVVVTRNSGLLILIPEIKTKELVRINLLRNTIVFPKSNQFLLKDETIGEVIDTKKQILIHVKPILAANSGEIIIPPINKDVNLLNHNKLIWILDGQVYNSPPSSFLNLHSDFKLNQNSFVFRSKILNHYTGFVKFINQKKGLSQKLVQIENKKDSLINSKFQKLKSSSKINNYILNLNNFNYLVKINEYQSKYYVNLTRNEKFGTLITNSFKTLTGGTLYYNYKNLLQKYNLINYIQSSTLKKYKPLIFHKTIIWLGEEVHKVNCEQNLLFVEDGDFISKEFELIPGLFSKTSGVVTLVQRNNLIKTISIKSGLFYKGKKVKNLAKKLYYPGEMILENIPLKNISFCEHIVGKTTDQLLIRRVEIYEFPNSSNLILNSKDITMFALNPKLVYSYKPNQFIKSIQNVNLASNILTFKTNKLLSQNFNIELSNNQKTNSVCFRIIEKLCLNNHIPANLRYKNIQSCFVVQENQFVSKYTTLGYLEAVTLKPLDIVKFKTKNQVSKEIFLISSNDCSIVKKEEIPGKKLNDFIFLVPTIGQTGRIISETDTLFLIQRGRLHFFPNCKVDEPIFKGQDLRYKIIRSNRIQSSFNTDRDILVNFCNPAKFSLKNQDLFSQPFSLPISFKSEFSKFFIKKGGKFYNSLVPQFFKKFNIANRNLKSDLTNLLRSNNSQKLSVKKVGRTLLLRSSKLIPNKNKRFNSFQDSYQLTMVKFVEQPFSKSTKSVGLYSITDDYFGQDRNSMFCNNGEFMEVGKTMALLKLEKEVTGDIVQGLPKIEEILEARKKNLVLKRVPTNRKKGLLVQKTTLTVDFDFKKLATPLVDSDRINPHKLLKIYFNYYGLPKIFICDKTKSFRSGRLLNNYDGSYKSFKKVQLFILNSVQAVYRSQGVTINNKHLEVIIKQMTTKVLITYEGDTPLSRREVIDLYHIQYINEIVNREKKQAAYYVPLLLGITKAALNNPSFISAASFQETTRVLTKAAIEGRIDWLRGLKENIIIGHLIPAGTGFPNYRKSFKRISTKKKMPIILNPTN